MIQFDIITIFPDIFDSYFKESFLKKAQDKKLIKIKIHDLRKWAKDSHRTVDDKPFGGGFGMVMKVEPIFKAAKELRKKDSKVILFSPRGKKFNQKQASDFSKIKHIIMVCGRYEGIDERVAKKIADFNLSIGDYVLMGGEIPAMTVIETVTRLIPKALGKEGFLKERVVKKGFIEQEQYTRPEVFEPKKGEKWKVPKVLLSGNHKEIEEWHKKHSKVVEN